MLHINMKLALLTFVIVPVMLWMAVYFSQKMTKTFRRMIGDIADFNARVEDNIGGMRVVQAFANESYEKKLFKENNGRFRLTKLLSYKIMAWNVSLSYILMRLVTVFVLICGTWFVIDKQITYGEFIAFVLFTNVFLGPIQKINNVIESYPKGIAGFKRYVEVMDTEPEVADRPNAVKVGHLDGQITFDSVSFGYGEEARVLNKSLIDSRREKPSLSSVHRARQNDDLQLAAAILRGECGQHLHRRHRYPRHEAGIAAPPDRHRAAGRVPVLRHHAGEHRLRQARRDG